MFRPKRSALLLAVALLLGTLAVSANADLSRWRRPFRVVGQDGEDVGSYCVLYLWTRTSGVMWMFDHVDRRPPDRQLYLHWPVTRDKGSDYEVGYWPANSFIGPFVTESNGILKWVIAKNGYQLLMDDKYSDPLNPRTVVLQPGDSEEFMKRLLDGKVSQEELRTLYRITDPRWQEIVVTLDAEDKERLKKCYYSP